MDVHRTVSAAESAMEEYMGLHLYFADCYVYFDDIDYDDFEDMPRLEPDDDNE